MSAEGTISQKAAPTTAHDDASTRLHGRALFLARALGFIVGALVLGLYVLSVPLQFEQLKIICTDNCQFGQLTAQNLHELQQLGLSMAFYAGYQVALNTLFFLVFVAVGVLIFWRKSNDWFGIYVALALVLFGISFSNPLIVVAKYHPAFSIPVLVLNGIGGTLIGVSMYLFPDGRFVPRWTRWLVPYVAAREFANVFLPALSSSPIMSAAFLIELSSYILAQIYRYRRVSSPVERQQTKWFVYGATVGILGFTSLILVFSLISPTGQPTSVVVGLVAITALYFFLLLIPLSIMMAILHYRLWDIDLLINRTLVYVPLTAILAGLFAATIVLSQRLFAALTGQQSDAATVLTTLVVVAAFTPVKDGLQGLVDKRFKEPPNPAKRLRAFNQELKSVIQVFSVEQTTRRFLDEATAAYEAASGAVYLEAEGQTTTVYTVGDWKGEAILSIALQNGGKRFGRVQLGARRNGADYVPQDAKTLQENAELVAAAIALAERTNGAARG
jgi:hypothetical protein